MNFQQFQDSANRTISPQGHQHFFGQDGPNFSKIQFDQRCDLIHAVVCLAGEVGELNEAVKKAMFYGKPLDEANLKEEAGDILWYIAGPLCRALGVTLESIAADNVAKLQKRYPEKYTDAAAIARADKLHQEAEAILETAALDAMEIDSASFALAKKIANLFGGNGLSMDASINLAAREIEAFRRNCIREPN